MYPTEKEKEKDLIREYEDYSINKLLQAKKIISNHLDFYFKHEDYESFWDSLLESTILSELIKEKSAY